MQERRRRQRFWFQQPVILRFRDWRQIHGVVENASERGVLLISGSDVPEGIQVEATIEMPHNIRVSAPGSVERVERWLDGKIAVAVKCHRPFSESANPSFIRRHSCLAGTEAGWPIEKGQIIIFKSRTGLRTGVLKEVRWGLVWRDFILNDGRVIPEHKLLWCPELPVWRKPEEVSREERKMWEGHLVCMAEAGLDPRDREHSFWAELHQYMAYTYLTMRDARIRRLVSDVCCLGSD